MSFSLGLRRMSILTSPLRWLVGDGGLGNEIVGADLRTPAWAAGKAAIIALPL